MSKLLGFVANVVCGQVLDARTRPNLVLWLNAEAGVQISPGSRTVLQWRDQSGGNYVFTPLSPAQHRAASARWNTALARQQGRLRAGENGHPDAAMRFIAAHKDDGKNVITFPAPLVANSLQLRDGITAFFVLKPIRLREGDQALGQRFFGHYPYGQFRFHDGRLAFRTDNGDHVYSSDDVIEGETLLAAYRFDGNVQMSLNGRQFEDSYMSRRKRSQPPAFSASGYVSLGGCPPHNSFVGDIAEVMIFGVPLGDAESRHVAEVLADRHSLALSPVADTAALPEMLPQFHAIHSQTHSPHPAIPALAAEIDGMEGLGQKGAKTRAIDRVPAYRHVKEKRRNDARNVDNESTSGEPETDLLTQLREAQAKLAQLQDTVQRQQLNTLAITSAHPTIDERSKTGLEGHADNAESLQRSAANAPVVAKLPTMADVAKPAKNPCLGGDAFEKVSITRWAPPETARLEQIQQWKDAKAQSDAAIKGYPRGGKELRDFVHSQVESLRLLRHNLFCSLLP